MAQPQYKDLILETIDSLRRRKARPDLERICHMVERRYGITLEETQADLEKLVDSKIVIKVDYKGSTSYRNAAKWRKSHIASHVFNSNDTSRKLLASFRALVTEAQSKSARAEDGPTEGERISFSVREIERRLLEEDPTTNISDLNLYQVLGKEVESGRLLKLPTGNYVLVDPKTPSSASGNGKLSPERARHASSGSTSPTKKGRPLGGIKRKIRHTSKGSKEPKLKKLSVGSVDEGEHSGAEDQASVTSPPPHVDDPDGQPSDSEREPSHVTHQSPPPLAPPPPPPPASSSSSNPSPVSYRASHAPSGPMAYGYVDNGESRCDYCLLTSECNRNGRAEELLFCKDCQAKAHPSCMDYSEDLAKRARNSPWQCIDCKTCYVCEDSGDPDAMLFCDACDKGYHMNCHNPPILDKPTGKWVCSKCMLELGLENEEALDTMEANDNEVGQANGHADNNNTININKNTDGGGASCLPTPCDSPVHFQDGPDGKDERSSASSSDNREHRPRYSRMSTTQYNLMLKMPGYFPTQSLPRLADTMPATVPDATEWSIDDVVQFFRDVGFIDQADVFREQEIDGRSLLLMRRSDVLTGLSLKLGPALKIYCHVQRLQKRCEQSL